MVLCLALLLTACTGPTAQETATPTPTPQVTPAATPTPEPVESWSPVYTDWSKLTPYEPPKPVYTRRYEGFTDTLIPADDYGPLLGFAGVSMSIHYAWDESNVYYDDEYHLYGLVTSEGEVIVDPVFSGVSAISRGYAEGPALLLLTKTFYGEDGVPEARAAAAALDGSWVTDYLYSYDWEFMYGVSFDQGVPLFKGDHALAFLDPATGRELRVADWGDQAGEDTWMNGFSVDSVEGWVSVNLFRYGEDTGYGEPIPLLFDPDGERHPLPEGVTYVGRYGEGLVEAATGDTWGNWSYGYVDVESGAWAIEPLYSMVNPFENGAALVCPSDRAWYFIDRTGEALTDPVACDRAERHGDHWYFLGYIGDVAAVYDAATHAPIESPLTATYTSVTLETDGWVTTLTNDGTLLVRGEEFYAYPADWGRLTDLEGDRLLFRREDEEGRTQVITLADRAGNAIAQWDEYDWAYLVWDTYTGTSYLRAYSYYGNDIERRGYYDLDGNLIPEIEDSESIRVGLLTDLGGYSGHSSLRTLEGERVFYWPIPQVAD